MSYLALYRKYRPISFDDVCGQEKIVTVLKNAVVTNKVSHAYLFCGPRGTGKTTIAKILARVINCNNLVDGNPCGKCDNCLNFNNNSDIVEIDAASNNGVDEIRELRDKVNLVPSNSKYKVYIIDEVHMLTTQAFNALLKTLEEPPSHVIFILATTDPQKVPLTITSRCQKFSFSRINDVKIVERLKKIVENEKIIVENDALFEIARLSDGGMRDAINMLDQLVAYNKENIVLDDVYKVNGSVSYEEMYELLKNIFENKQIEIINFVEELNNSGKNIEKFIQDLILFLKDVLVYKNTDLLTEIESKNKYVVEVSKLIDNKKIYFLIENLSDILNKIKFSLYGYIIFMTNLLKISCENVKSNSEIISREINDKSNLNEKKENGIKKETISNINQQKKDSGNCLSLNDIELRINNTFATATKDSLNFIKIQWQKLDEFINDDNFSVVSGLLIDSNPVVSSKKYVIITNKLKSVVDRINSNINLVENILNKITNLNIVAVAIDEKQWQIEKEKYILNLKKGIKYNIIEYKEEKGQSKKDDSVNRLINLVGEGIVEYK